VDVGEELVDRGPGTFVVLPKQHILGGLSWRRPAGQEDAKQMREGETEAFFSLCRFFSRVSDTLSSHPLFGWMLGFSENLFPAPLWSRKKLVCGL
jgi:hypothetical protein